ncbi:hypothetical protein LWC33_29525 [Pseudonocardia sp. RS11V-5]|uniref:hypothetical protein n=1 Tax=Pseudonocardia terrae TaxID=2905831 RepID=UPI001E63F521|nr:hypothetical protein [Pseudonocardia terrae]MCE3555572.1 hypothetical protein [Pseudonocardia terrae]
MTAPAPLSDDFPVLLGPVRVQTRFTASELLVRVFPDDWSVDKFEPLPTVAELTALDAYWTAVWQAGGNGAAKQAAWEELIGRVPSGRAAWLLSSRQPANPADQPTGVPPSTTVLVVLTPTPVAAADRQATVTYWTAVWRAHGDRAATGTANIALTTSVGATRGAAIRGLRPAGIDAAPSNPSDAVQVAFLVLPEPAQGATAAQSWTKAARARLLPDRFTVLGYVGGQRVISVTGATIPPELVVSPDPGTTDQLTVDEQTGVLHVPDDLLWLTDFDRAVQVGMGVRIPLDDNTRAGVDRLVVFGMRRASTPDQTATDLADLITRQMRSPAGFAFVPQGTPTNNTEQRPAGQDPTPLAPPAAASPAAPTDWSTKSDGRWFAELVGVDPAIVAGAHHADQTDHRDARAANVALWPATWGSYLQTMLHPVLGAAPVDATRDFFTRHVSGRGPVPAVRIGRQPYGVLPTTAFSRLAWPDAAATAPHRRALHQLLTAAAADWRTASAKVARLGTGGDPHQMLLDILALHPTSAEFYQRYAQSVEDVYNRENLGGLGPTVLPTLDELHMPQSVRALLARLGHVGAPDPDLIRRLFVGAQYPLLAPLVDDRPLSETDPVRAYTTDQRNYLRWLADLAGTDLETVRLEKGFIADRAPAALLYLLLRHAVLLGWADAARRLALAAGSALAQDPVDPPFIHIGLADPAAPSESRFRQLYTPDPAVTGSPSTLPVDYLPTALDGRLATAQLAEQVQALGLLADVPTARLERVLVEHLDCATYRLDAWQLGLANERLAELRYGPDGTAAARTGLHLGAYGWLEDIRPRTRQLSPVQLTGDLAQLFTPPGSSPLLHDPTNGGYLHAPSPAQARTAAVLRAGYLANATPENPGTFAVNLSSDRVRAALAVLNGLRSGQSLGALLGYRFERGLHDRFAEAELDTIIAALRGAFPLRAGRLEETRPATGTSADLVEARNVVDGLELVRRVTRTQDTTYPFGAVGLPVATDVQLAAISAEVQRLLDLHDAVADLAIAESTHQTLAGNPDRAAATLDAYAKEGFPPDPAVVRTPRSGVTLTHRLGLQFTPGLHPPVEGATPRAQAEPAVNDWLPGLLPQAFNVVATVTWTDPVNGQAQSRVVSQQDVGLSPIDLLWAVRPADEAAMTDLDDRILGVVVERDGPRPDALLSIRYTQRVTNRITFFELSGLVATLRRLLTTSRPLRPSDLVPAAGSATVDRGADDVISLSRERPAAVRASLNKLAGNVTSYISDLGALLQLTSTEPQRTQVISGIDTFLQRYADLVGTASGFGLVRSSWGELIKWRRDVFRDVLAAVAATADRMGRSLAAADALIHQYDALAATATDEARFALLQQAERLLTTSPTSPRPATPSQLRATVATRRQAFDARLQALRRQGGTGRNTLSGLLTEVAAKLPLTDLDPTGLDLTSFHDRVIEFARDLLNRVTALQSEIARRLTAADAALAVYDQVVSGLDRVTAGTAALSALLGDDVLVVPEYTLGDQQAAELQQARRASDDLVAHLVHDVGRDIPVDDWIHGVARVRDKARLWERATLLSDALRGEPGPLGDPPGVHDPTLVPIQLPVQPDDHWLAMEFAAGATITEDRLLYTAHYASTFLPQNILCGLLLDEWTEVIPADGETTGIAVDLDSPDSEPPQAMLLVVPPVRTGTWSDDDLVAAVMETFDLATLRAVEPGHLDDTAYAQLLPATVLSATPRPITISTDLAVANLRWKSRD